MIALDPVHANGRTLRQRFGLPALALLAVATFVIGTVGFTHCRNDAGDPYSLADAFYQSIRLFTLESGFVDEPVPWQVQLARFLAPALTFTAVAQALAGIFRSELQGFRLSRSRGHIVICGAGAKASALIRDYGLARQRMVIIDKSPPEDLQDVPGQANVFAIRGDATHRDTLKQARAERAERVFITTGDDSTNIEIAAALIRHCKSSRSRKGRVACHVHLVDHQTGELFRRHEIFKDAADRVDMHTFNVYENAARLLWRERLLACGPLAPDENRRPHIVIGGLGQMGEAVLLRLVRSAHYAKGRKPAITVFDIEADACKERLLERYPALPHLCDLDFVQSDLAHPKTAGRMAAVLASADQLGSVVFCLDDDYENFAAALRLAPHLREHAVPIFIRLSRAAGLSELLHAEHSDSALALQIDGFGLNSVCCTRDLVLTDQLSRTARSLQEAYLADRLRDGVPASDHSLRPWEKLDEAFQESSREQAEHLELKLRTFGYSAAATDQRLPEAFSDAQVEILGRMEHARWVAERELAGWTYAPGPKDAARRTSPDLVPWEQLPPDIQKIDFDFVVAIPRILAASRGK